MSVLSSFENISIWSGSRVVILREKACIRVSMYSIKKKHFCNDELYLVTKFSNFCFVNTAFYHEFGLLKS
jgi:hypothetical protein